MTLKGGLKRNIKKTALGVGGFSYLILKEITF